VSQPGARAIPLRAYRDAAGEFATGVTVVIAEHDGQGQGMTLNAFTSVSLEPLLVLVSLPFGLHIHPLGLLVMLVAAVRLHVISRFAFEVVVLLVLIEGDVVRARRQEEVVPVRGVGVVRAPAHRAGHLEVSAPEVRCQRVGVQPLQHDVDAVVGLQLVVDEVRRRPAEI